MVALKEKEKRGFLSRLRRLPRAWIGSGLVVFITLTAIFAPILAPTDPL
jgi:hypothetical protein